MPGRNPDLPFLTIDPSTAAESPAPTPARPWQAPISARIFASTSCFAVRVEVAAVRRDLTCVARNISAGGVFLELADPLPPRRDPARLLPRAGRLG